MTKKKFILFFTGCFLFLSVSTLFPGCNSQKEKENVDRALTFFFEAYKQDSYREINRGLFSDRLISLLDQATEREKREVQLILDSDYPTDKPFMLDFDVFTSMVEGADSIRILKTEIKADTAWVDVLCVDTAYNGTIEMEWNDRFLLIKKTDWVLDNVIYGVENMEFKNLQDLLEDYIHTDNAY